MNVHFIESDHPEELNSSIWRVRKPAAALIRAGHTVTVGKFEEFIKIVNVEKIPEIAMADIVVIQRRIDLPVMSHALTIQDTMNIPVLLDLDDGYHVMSSSVVTYPYWKGKQFLDERTKKYIAMDYSGLDFLKASSGSISGISAPAPAICEYWSDYTKTYLLRNYIDTSFYQSFQIQPRANNTITIGWGGSGSHVDSFVNTEICSALVSIAKNNPKVRLLLAGSSQEVLRKFRPVADKIVYIPWGPFEQWPSTLRKIDIGIVPLYGPYDECRSWIKPLEYSLYGIPWVGSSNKMTKDFANASGLQCNLVKNRRLDWIDAIQSLVDSEPELHRDAVEWAESQDIFKNTDKILHLYEEVINDFRSSNNHV